MTALPIFDETRREFVSAPEPAPPASLEASTPATSGAAPATGTGAVPSDRSDPVGRFHACLARLHRDLCGSGNIEDAETIAELIQFLNRHRAAASTDAECQPIFAVSAAYIDALTTICIDEAASAQLLARSLVGLGYALPKQGGDTRGWKRLLVWRDQLHRGRLPNEMREVYDRALRFARHAPMEIDLKAALDYALAPGDGVMHTSAG